MSVEAVQEALVLLQKTDLYIAIVQTIRRWTRRFCGDLRVWSMRSRVGVIWMMLLGRTRFEITGER